MKIHFTHFSSICVAIFAALIVACSSLAQPPGDTQRPTANGVDARQPSPSVKRRRPLMYIGDSNKIQIVPEVPPHALPTGRIKDGVNSAQGLWVDRHGALYVANGWGTITVYARGSRTPETTYYDPHGPKYLAVDHDGNVFVSNSNGTVMEFLRGMTQQPHHTWKTPGTQADGVDLDAQGNLYVAYRDTSNGYGSIEKFTPGTASSRTGQILGMAVNQPQGLVRTNDGWFIVANTGNKEYLQVFPPGSLQASQTMGFPDIPTQLVIEENERRLFFVGSAVWDAPIQRSPTGNLEVLAFHVRKNFGYNHGEASGMALTNGQTF
jgi:hypothetical protein